MVVGLEVSSPANDGSWPNIHSTSGVPSRPPHTTCRSAVLLTAKAMALFAGRINVSFDDLAAAAPPALRHRILLNFEGEAEGIDMDALIAELVRETPTVSGRAPT